MLAILTEKSILKYYFVVLYTLSSPGIGSIPVTFLPCEFLPLELLTWIIV